jgi:hypothetical protein
MNTGKFPALARTVSVSAMRLVAADVTGLFRRRLCPAHDGERLASCVDVLHRDTNSSWFFDTPGRLVGCTGGRNMSSHLSSSLITIAVLTLASCAPARSLQPRDVVQSQFSHSHYCPLERVQARLIENVPPAPPPIANDPARQAMWTYEHRGAEAQSVGGDGATPMIVQASGCDENAVFLCRAEGGYVSSRRRVRYELLFTVCTETNPPPI